MTKEEFEAEIEDRITDVQSTTRNAMEDAFGLASCELDDARQQLADLQTRVDELETENASLREQLDSQDAATDHETSGEED